mmetsp:Transcript_47632/g.153164  ORF Transcript_47632/g.153164 Transcript_47632/m.153164 type:complete len:93 (+) Transcript_47632:476-754(+)
MGAAAADSDISIVGQFGVGFYSGDFVMDTIRVTSNYNDEELHIQEFDAEGPLIAQKDNFDITSRTGITTFMAAEAAGDDIAIAIAGQFSDGF